LRDICTSDTDKAPGANRVHEALSALAVNNGREPPFQAPMNTYEGSTSGRCGCRTPHDNRH